MEKKLLKLKSITGFVSCINDFIENFIDYKTFKNDLDNVFINKDLLNVARKNLVSKETLKFEKSLAKKSKNEESLSKIKIECSQLD